MPLASQNATPIARMTVVFFASDAESLYRSALRKAIVQARERAEVLADAAGANLSRIISIEPSSSGGGSVAASSTTRVVAPTQSVTASVELVFALR